MFDDWKLRVPMMQAHSAMCEWLGGEDEDDDGRYEQCILDQVEGLSRRTTIECALLILLDPNSESDFDHIDDCPHDIECDGLSGTCVACQIIRVFAELVDQEQQRQYSNIVFSGVPTMPCDDSIVYVPVWPSLYYGS